MSFQYTGSSGKPKFQCNLTCYQCTAHVKKGGRCKKKTCGSLPLCWIHLKERGLKIAKSSIPNSGKGVFATKNFDKGALVGNYFGQELTRDQLNKRYGATNADFAPYGLAYSNNTFLDAACKRSYSSMINHKPSSQANVSFSVDRLNRRINVKTSKPIKKGDELFVNYGRDYFKNSNAPQPKFHTSTYKLKK